MNIAARLMVQSAVSYGAPEKDCEHICLTAVYSDDPSSPNYAYSVATPCATMNLTITNPDAWGAFEEGELYDLLFTPVKAE